ncbi:ribosome recycling factor [candidate division WWE3 bacterium RIFOXYC1_FULL_39_7]|uniref:Ribosome-recycling factor n=2 Tax=Katanobacteria TaxID=422282 RepID=A0A1F4X973_UNCKA|nr:MAG: ribosome recycling factor [candidate division WWE3 bacterium RIFOXYC1_FULL_39_7]OGC77603.1 MAG: ribosome recycling factor [candidate division WWE3 bacterium RIFOXYD1_FULL_39_9]
MTIAEFKSRLNKSLDFLVSELSQIRTGRANPALIENVSVEAYGSKMSLKELGSISLLDTQNLVVIPWDKSLIHAIAKAIRESDLKLNAIDDPDKVRVPIPSLTEERRIEFTKIVSTKVEECKNAMRNVRQEAMKDIDKSFADKEIGEDEKFREKEEIEKIMKEYLADVDEHGESKKEDLLKI